MIMITNNKFRLTSFAIAVLGLVLSTAPSASLAGHENSLPGSDFEIDADANLIVDEISPSLDWVNVLEARKMDLPSGKNDDSFGRGAKEDTITPTVVTGSIPPNKSDLLNFGVYEENNADGQFLHLFWHRVQDPKGTTNMDFEFNQATAVTDSDIPTRTPGDVLIVYELSKGGKIPELYLFRWLDGSEATPCEASNTYPCWGDRTTLSDLGYASGSINSSTIPIVESDGLGEMDPRTFGEASIDLSAVFTVPGECQSFGLAQVKSRSSDSFTAALKDRIGPLPVHIANCGSVSIIKVNTAEDLLADAEFTLFNDFEPIGIYDENDTSTGNTCSTDSEGNCAFKDLEPGSYCVVETQLPPNYYFKLTEPQCFTVESNETYTFTFVNSAGA